MSSYFPTITLEGTKSEEDTTKLTNRDGSNATILILTQRLNLFQLLKQYLISVEVLIIQKVKLVLI